MEALSEPCGSNRLNPPFSDIRMRQAVPMVADQRDYLSAMAGDPKNWRACFLFYTCDGAEPNEQAGRSPFRLARFQQSQTADRRGGLSGLARAAWFAATDDARRRDLADRIQERAFEFVPYIPTGQLVGRRAFRKNLAGVVDAPIPFLWNIEKRP
jgi:hypothetical protein